MFYHAAEPDGTLDDRAARDALLALLSEWLDQFKMPRLSEYGIARADISLLVSGAGSGLANQSGFLVV